MVQDDPAEWVHTCKTGSTRQRRVSLDDMIGPAQRLPPGHPTRQDRKGVFELKLVGDIERRILYALDENAWIQNAKSRRCRQETRTPQPLIYVEKFSAATLVAVITYDKYRRIRRQASEQLRQQTVQ